MASKSVTAQLAGPITIQATAAGLASDSTAFTIVPAAADHLTITSPAANLASGGARSLTAEVRDAVGNLVTSDSSTSVTFSKTSGSGTVTGLGAATAASGVAQISVTGQIAGTITIDATAAGLGGDATTFDVVPATSPTQVVITSSTADLASGSTRTLTAEVRDSAGNLVSGDNGRSISFAKTGGAGTVTGLGTAATANGIAQLNVAGAVAGAVTIDASAASLASGSSTFAVVPGSADHLTVTSGTGNLASGTTRTLTAEVRDAAGNLVTGDNSTSVTFAKTAGTGTVTGLGAATATGGIASRTVTGQTAGTITIDATAAGPGADSTTFAVEPGAADHVTITSGTGTLASGSARTLTAEVRDAAGNLVTGDNSTSVTFAKTSGAGTVTGLGAATATGGIASRAVTGQTAGTITIGAAAAGLGGGSTTFTVAAGPADHLSVTSSTADLASGAARILTTEVRDAADNLVTGDNSTSVTFAKISGTGTVTGLGAATAAGGVASRTVTGHTAGTLAIGAAAAGLGSGATSFDVVAGAPASIALSGSAADLASGTNRLLTATVEDAAGNTVTWDNTTMVTFGQAAGGGSVSGLGTAPVASGIATKTVAGGAAGLVTLTASAPLLGPDAISFAVVAGTADHLTIVSGTSSLRETNQRTLVAELRDASENVLTGDSSTTVTFARTAGPGDVTGLGAATTANGVASKTVTASTPGAIAIAATAGGVAAGSTSFTIDPLATVSITGGPTGLVATSSASIAFTGSEGGLTFECKLDSGSFAPCTSPVSYSGLADGAHTVSIHAIADGATGPDATRSWTSDTGVPTVTIDSGPSGTIAVDSASFAFSASESVGFECSLDSAPFGPCTSPGSYGTLLDGAHTFEVRGTDGAGNQSATASRAFSVAAPPPTVAIAAPLTYVTTPATTITADAADTGTGLASVTFYECSNTSLDCATGTFSAVGVDTTSPYSTAWSPVPSDGRRAIRAIASDGHGRAGSDTVNVTVDQTPPAANLTGPGANVHGTVALSAAATDATSGVGSVSFQKSAHLANSWSTVDSDTTSPYAGAWTTTPADDGVYDLRVFVTDLAGNTSTDVVTGVRVDNTPPAGTLDDPGRSAAGRSRSRRPRATPARASTPRRRSFEARQGAAAVRDCAGQLDARRRDLGRARGRRGQRRQPGRDGHPLRGRRQHGADHERRCSRGLAERAGHGHADRGRPGLRRRPDRVPRRRRVLDDGHVRRHPGAGRDRARLHRSSTARRTRRASSRRRGRPQ